MGSEMCIRDRHWVDGYDVQAHEVDWQLSMRTTFWVLSITVPGRTKNLLHIQREENQGSRGREEEYERAGWATVMSIDPRLSRLDTTNKRQTAVEKLVFGSGFLTMTQGLDRNWYFKYWDPKSFKEAQERAVFFGLSIIPLDGSPYRDDPEADQILIRTNPNQQQIKHRQEEILAAYCAETGEMNAEDIHDPDFITKILKMYEEVYSLSLIHI